MSKNSVILLSTKQKSNFRNVIKRCMYPFVDNIRCELGTPISSFCKTLRDMSDASG